VHQTQGFNAARRSILLPTAPRSPRGLLLLAQTAVPSEPANLKVWAYLGFIALVLPFLALDLGVFHREAHEVGMKEALGWSALWLGCGLAFTAFVYGAYQHRWLGLAASDLKSIKIDPILSLGIVLARIR
jgi:hypothetical protein